MRQKFLLLAAVVFGLLAFLLTYRQLEVEKQKLRGDSETVVLIRLKRDMVEGEEIKDGDLVRFPVRRARNSGELSREIPWSECSRVIGRQLDSSMVAGQTLQSTDLKPLSRRQGFTGGIKSGQRAVTVPVDAVASVNYLIQPNDNVDVIGTFRFPDNKADAAMETVPLALLENVRVLATGARWTRTDNDAAAGAPYGTVTMLLYPDEAEMMVFAAGHGSLQLVLRNFEDEKVDSEIKSRSINFNLLEKEIPFYNKRRGERRLMP